MNKKPNKIFKVFACFCIFSIFILGVVFTNTKAISLYANIKNWNIEKSTAVQNERVIFPQNVVVEHCVNASTLNINYTTTLSKSAEEYFVRFAVEGVNSDLRLNHKKIVVASESIDSEHIESKEKSTSRSPKNTPRGLSAFAILGIVTLCVCVTFGIGIGIYHLVEKIKKDRKENKDKVK